MYRLFALVVAGLLVLSACSSSAGTTPTITDPPQGGDGTEIIIDNFEFTPNLLDVKVGDTVTWVNQQDVAHTSTSNVEGGWSSGLIEPGESFSFTFTEAGQFPYICTIHPSMIGAINVAP